MNHISRRHSFALPITFLSIIGFAVGCGPRVQRSPELEKSQPTVIALLPVTADPDVRKERVEFLYATVSSELKNRGYELLERRIVTQTCSVPECPERTRLAENFGVQAFARLEIESNSNRKFLVGHVNSVRGVLTLTDAQDRELIQIKNTETESGGLLFNSGQVFQGIREEFANFGDDGFNRLAGKFAKTLVSQLPQPVKGAAPLKTVSLGEAEIDAVDVRLIRPTIYELCARARPNMIASVVFQRQRTTLRAAEPGKYCGIFRINQNFVSTRGLAVEVRSPYGEAVRREVQLASTRPCDLDGIVQLFEQPGSRKLVVSCVTVGGKDLSTEPCSMPQKACSAEKIVVYRSPTIQGPFEKVAEVRNNAWTDRTSENLLYQVVAVSDSGLRSLPAAPVKPVQPVVGSSSSRSSS